MSLSSTFKYLIMATFRSSCDVQVSNCYLPRMPSTPN